MKRIVRALVLWQAAIAGGMAQRVAIVDAIHRPSSVAELVELSPVVVVGTCESVLPSRPAVENEPNSDVVRDRILRVDEVLKGRLRMGDRIAVEEMEFVTDLRPIELRQRYLLFLRPIARPAEHRFSGLSFQVTGIWAGSMQLANGRVRIADAVDGELHALNGRTEAEMLRRVRDELLSRRP